MKAVYTGKKSYLNTDGEKLDLTCDLTEGKTYDVTAIENGWYRVVDDSGEDYIYPPGLFEIVEK